MRVVLGWTLLLGFVGVVLLIATAAHVRAAWLAVSGASGNRYLVLGLIVALAAAVALAALTRSWAQELNAFRAPWIAATSGVLALLTAFGAWAAFSIWIVGFGESVAKTPADAALWVAAMWFIGTVLWTAFVAWDHARWRVLRRVQAWDPTTPGPRRFAGSIVAVPGEPMLRDPLHGAACVSWSVDDGAQETDDAAPGADDLDDRWMLRLGMAAERTCFGGEASDFYVVIGDTFIRVRPEGIEMHGRPGPNASLDAVHLDDRRLAERVRAQGAQQIRTRVLTVGDPVIAAGVIAADDDGRLVLQAGPDGAERAALVPKASVRVRR